MAKKQKKSKLKSKLSPANYLYLLEFIVFGYMIVLSLFYYNFIAALAGITFGVIVYFTIQYFDTKNN